MNFPEKRKGVVRKEKGGRGSLCWLVVRINRSLGSDLLSFVNQWNSLNGSEFSVGISNHELKYFTLCCVNIEVSSTLHLCRRAWYEFSQGSMHISLLWIVRARSTSCLLWRRSGGERGSRSNNCFRRQNTHAIKTSHTPNRYQRISLS